MRNLVIFALALALLPLIAQAQLSNNARMTPIFLENLGQVSTSDGKPADNVLYYMQTPALDFFITTDGITYVFKEFVNPENDENYFGKFETPTPDINWHRVDVSFEGAEINRENAKSTVAKNAPGVSFYKENFRTGEGGMPVLERVVFENAWPKIDIEFVAGKEHLKYNFILHPGADINNIKMTFKGQDELSFENGNLVISTSLGKIEEGALVSFSENGAALDIKYQLEDNKLGFYSETDLSQINETIIIDPPLVWSTYYGGSGWDEPLAMEYNAGNGYIYVLLKTSSTTLYLPNPGVPAYYRGTNAGKTDLLLMKYDTNGVMNWITFVGGSEDDLPGNLFHNGVLLFVVGHTLSSDFPIANFPGGYNDNSLGGTQDAFIMAFSAGESLIWSTYFGGSSEDKFTDVVYGNNRIYAVGETKSNDISTANPGGGAYYVDTLGGYSDAYLAEFNNNLNLVWGTYLGGSEYDALSICDMDNTGRLAVAFDAFSNDIPLVNSISGSYSASHVDERDIVLMAFNPYRTNIWTTYVGGSDKEWLNDIIFDDNNYLYVVGVSYSINFPVSNGLGAGYYQAVKSGYSDAVQMMFSNNLALMYSSFYGGNYFDVAFGITIDSKKRIYIVGDANSSNLPVLNPNDGSYFDGTLSGLYDGFLAEYDSVFNLRWATYLGGRYDDKIEDIRVTDSDHIFTVGYSQSNNHPLVDMGSGSYYDNSFGGNADAILTKFIPCPNNFDTLYGIDSVCMNESGMIYALGSGTSYTWSTTETNDTIYPVIVSDTMFTVSVVGPYGCIERDTFMVTMNPLPVFNFYGDTAVCMNDSATIWVDDGYASYLWEYGQTDSAMTFLPAASEYIDVTVTNIYGCVHTDSTYLQVYPLPVASITGDTAVCLNDTATMIASGGSSYIWSNMSSDTMIQVSPASAGIHNYYVIATDSNMCSDTAFFSVEFYPLPEFWLGNDTTLCQGDSLLLDASNPFATHVWSTADTTQTIYVNTQNTYYAVVIDSNFCKYSDTIDVAVIPHSDATINDVLYVCENMTPFDFSAADPGGTWSGTGITNDTNGTFNPAIAGVGFHNIYYVIGGLCGDSDTSVIEVAEVPKITLYTTDETCSNANDGSINIVATGGQTPYTYLMDTSIVSETITMLSPGVYHITVIDDRGCLDTTSTVILAEDFPCGNLGYYIPNIFSPNGDGNNDVLFVRSNFIDVMHFLIYDRFGEKVFETRDPNEGWDGKYNGQPVQSGVYYYVFKADMIDGSYVKDKGNITVVR